MKAKRVFFAVLVVFQVLAINLNAVAVNTSRIEVVRNKAVLDSRDFEIIDKFVASAVRELVLTKEFDLISKIRNTVLTRDKSAIDSSSAQYAAQFSESSYKHISEAPATVDQTVLPEHVFRVTINLLILTC